MNKHAVTSFCAKIVSPSHEWDITEPHLNHATEGWDEGTVFYVQGSEVGMHDHNVVGITNFHVIENNAQHVARIFDFSGGHYDCRVLHVCPTLDFAVLEAPPGTVCTGAIDVKTPPCGTSVMIPGFPLSTSSDSCQFSYGHMSAPIGDQWLQCSLSCNSGNSGGPLVLTKTSSVCGICTASPYGAEGITLALPIVTVVETIRKFAKPGAVLIRTPQLLSTLRPITDAQASLMSLPPTGLVISDVSPQCPLRDLQEMDVIVSVNGMPVNTQTGKVPSNSGGWDIDLSGISSWVLLPTNVPITVRRQGVKGDIYMHVNNKIVLLPPLRQLHPLWEPIPVVSMAGATCVPLCKNVLDSYEDYENSRELRACWTAWDQRHNSAQLPMVVVVFVEPHSYAAECGVQSLQVFKKINGVAVSTVNDIVAILQASRPMRSRTMQIEFLTQCVAVDTHMIRQRTPADNLCPVISL